MDEQQTFHWTDLNPVCLLRRLLRELPCIVAAGLSVAMLAVAVLQITYHPRYAASATLAVNVKSSSYSSVFSNLTTSAEIADTFTELFSSNLFSEVAKSQLGTDSLPGTLTASVMPETNLLILRVTADSPGDAFRTLRLMLENYDTVSEYVFQNVVLKELDSPVVPAAPSNPLNNAAIAKKAFILGGAAMAALVLGVSLLADTVQTTSAVQRKLDIKLFGSIHHEEKNKTVKTRLKRTNKGLLINMPVAGFRFAEEVHRLAAKLGYALRGDTGKVVLITSVLENEGKSTVAVNLALALADEGKKVLLIDADLHKAAQFKLLNCRPRKRLADVLRGDVPYEPQYLEREKLYVLLSAKSAGIPSELIASDAMGALLDRARQEMDCIIVDSPPMSLFSDVEALADRADASLLVVRQDFASVRQINDAADILRQCDAQLLGCVFNDVRTMPFTGEQHGYGYGYGYGGKYGYSYGYGYGYGSSRKQKHTQAEENHGST